MAKTHWKKLTNPDYLGAYSFEEGKDMIVTIKEVTQETITGAKGEREECVVAHFENGVKPLILNKTNMKRIEKVAESPYIEEWGGVNLQLYTEKVPAFGTVTDAVRVREFKPEV